MLRRRRLPDHLEERRRAFEALLPTVERAGAALTESVPGTRLPGRPLAETLLEFEDGLREARAGMEDWRAAEVEDVWRSAADGIDRALALADRLRTRADDPANFEGLIGTIGHLLEPLDAFADAAERFRTLRRRPAAPPRGGS